MKAFLLWTGLLLAAMAQQAAHKPVRAQVEANPQAANATKPFTSTPEFAVAAAMADLFQIEMAKAALGKTSDPQLLAFARLMIKEHNDATTALKGVLKSHQIDVQLPDALDAEHQAKLEQLKAASGSDFDQAYAAAQQESHAHALGALHRYAEHGDNASMKQFAVSSAERVEQSLAKAQSLP